MKLANEPTVAFQGMLLLIVLFMSIGGGLGAIIGRPFAGACWALLMAIWFILFAIPVVHR